MKARLILLVVAIASVVAAIGVSPASAYEDTRSGSPGVASPYSTTGSFYMGYASIGGGAVKAYRSPGTSATATQRVTVRWRVGFTYGGTWQIVHDVSTTYIVGANQYVNHPGWTYETPYLGHFSTDLRITWRTSTGAFLGERFQDFNQSSDYQCLVWNGCAVVWIGGRPSLKMN
jgi:hypothetical protein